MSAKPEWEVLADLALRRLEKDYERTQQAKPVVRIQQFKEGDVVSLAGMSTAMLEGAKGTVCGPIDADTLRYPVKLSSPEVPARCLNQHAHRAHAAA
jgi:NMD protein affecting ribosome stability and mRNA decay